MPKLRHIKEAEGRKRAKLPWPPVGEGGEFIVEKEDAEKWSKATHTSTVATAMFHCDGTWSAVPRAFLRQPWIR